MSPAPAVRTAQGQAGRLVEQKALCRVWLFLVASAAKGEKRNAFGAESTPAIQDRLAGHAQAVCKVAVMRVTRLKLVAGMSSHES